MHSFTDKINFWLITLGVASAFGLGYFVREVIDWLD
jgi:hypothetical protein